MGDTEDVKPVKPEKLSSPTPNQSNIHVYPDWAALQSQAYYGSRVAVPPYFNPTVASAQAPPPYMWGPPQPVMPPYGIPYAALYPHGGVYAHPGAPPVANPMYMDAHANSSGTTEHGLINKSEEIDGHRMSAGNVKADTSDDGTEHTLTDSRETEGSCDGNSRKADLNGLKGSREEDPHTTEEIKIETQSSSITPYVQAKSKKSVDVSLCTPVVAGRVLGTAVSPSVTSSQDLKDSPKANTTNSLAVGHQPSSLMPNDSRLHNERDLKRERRKQCNRESARRSRMKKQAEFEVLSIKVHTLTAEKMAIKSEIDRSKAALKKVKNDNARLLDKIKNKESEEATDVGLGNTDEKRASTPNPPNLLYTVDSANSDERGEREGEMYEKRMKPGAKLLDAKSRADALAAG